MKIEFIHNGVKELSEGPYGYIILGLKYYWDFEESCLKINKVILVELDMKLRYSIDCNFYSDVFEHSFFDIYEENGKHYFNGKPVLNYDMISIPEKIKDKDWLDEKHVRKFYNKHGDLKYSINPICTGKGDFGEVYEELYACVLSFDEKTLSVSAVGFDSLGKIVTLNYKNPIEEVCKDVIDDFYLKYYKPEDEKYKRALEYSFLNLSYEIDEDGNKKYNYKSIWDSE